MNPDRIRQAVELAKGWKYDERAPYGPMAATPFRGWQYIEDWVQAHYDALAAQLTRQIHDLGPDITIMSDFGGCSMICCESQNTEWHVGDCRNPKEKDRTANTLNAILDSGVLK